MVTSGEWRVDSIVQSTDAREGKGRAGVESGVSSNMLGRRRGQVRVNTGI